MRRFTGTVRVLRTPALLIAMVMEQQWNRNRWKRLTCERFRRELTNSQARTCGRFGPFRSDPMAEKIQTARKSVELTWDRAGGLLVANEEISRRKTLQATREQAARLQNEFWARAVAYAQKDPSPVKAESLLQSLNQVIDLESARWMAFQNHVPRTVIYVNYIVAIYCNYLGGICFRTRGSAPSLLHVHVGPRDHGSTCLIVDLDQPRQGFIRGSQQPLVDLQH